MRLIIYMFTLIRFTEIQVLIRWLRNVWRVRKVPKLELRRYRLTDVLWWTEQERVFKEIASLMGIDDADSTKQGWFILRTKASKNIIARMRSDERNALEALADQFQSKGLPRGLQRT